MSWNSVIDDFEAKQRSLKGKVKQKDSLNKNILFRFADIDFYEGMNVDLLDKNKIILGHVYLHQKYSNKTEDKNKLSNLHIKFKKAMEKEGLTHFYVDKLDKI